MTADDLTAQLAADVDAAFPALVDRHAGLLYGVALRLLGNPHDAEEVAQEALVRAHGALHRYPATRVRSLQSAINRTSISVFRVGSYCQSAPMSHERTRREGGSHASTLPH